MSPAEDETSPPGDKVSPQEDAPPDQRMSAQEDAPPDDRVSPQEDVSFPQRNAKKPSVRRTACFRLFREGVSQFGIEYKDKDDLYASLIRKIDQLHIPRRKMYFLGDYEDYYEINNADTLHGLALDNHVVKINVCAEDGCVDPCSDDSDFAHISPGQKRETKSRKCNRSQNCDRPHMQHHNRNRPHSKDHHRGRHCTCECHWYIPRFNYEPSFCHNPLFYGRLPHTHYGYPPLFSTTTPFHFNKDPRLQHCPFFGLRHAPSNHRCNGWQSGYYGY